LSIDLNIAALQRREFLRNAGIFAGAGIFASSLSRLASAAVPDGNFDLSAYRGSVVYLDFWASWCAPCKLSFRFMRDMRNRYQARDLAIVTVNVDRDQSAAQAFLHANGDSLPVIYDPAGKLAAQFKVATMPTSFVIDRKGQTRFTHSGYFENRSDEYNQHVAELIAQHS
jgi:thiol-disulfide isomerase/thioredoxin